MGKISITEIRKRAITSSHLRGFSLAMTLVFAVILLLIGIVITGLTTMQSRYSLERNSDIITRQAAVAGVNMVQKKLMDLEEWTPGNIQSAVKDIYGQLPDTGAAYFIDYNTVPGTNSDRVCQITSHGFFRREPAKSFTQAPLSDPNNRLWDKRIRMNFCLIDAGRAITATGKSRPMPWGDLASEFSLSPRFNERLAAAKAKFDPSITSYTVFVGNSDIYGELGTDIINSTAFTNDIPVLINNFNVLTNQEATANNQNITVQYPESAGKIPAIFRFDYEPEDLGIKKRDVEDYSIMETPVTKYPPINPNVPNPQLTIPDTNGISQFIGPYNYKSITLNAGATLKLRNNVREVETFEAVGTEAQPCILNTESVSLDKEKEPAVFLVTKKLVLDHVSVNPVEAGKDAKPPSSVIFYINENYEDEFGHTQCCTAKITNSQCNCIFTGNADVFVGCDGSNLLKINGYVTGNTVTVIGASTEPDCCKIIYHSDNTKKSLVLGSWEEL